MALVKLAGGVEIDLATGDELKNGLTKPLDALLNKQDPKPLFLQRAVSVSGSAATSPTATLIIGSPPAGRIWNIRSVTCVGNNDHGAVTSPVGFVAMYFGDPFNPTLGSLQLVKVTLPSTSFVSTDALWCPAGQQVFFMTDAAVNAPAQGRVTVNLSEWRVADVMAQTGAP